MSDGYDLTFGTPAIVPQPGEADDDPVTSSEQMSAAAEEESSEDVDAPEESCKKPWLEVTFLGEDDDPVASAAVKVDLPSLQQEATLDGNGFIHLDDVEETPKEITVRVMREMDAQGNKTMSLEVVSKESEPTQELEEAVDKDVDVVDPPFDPI